MASPMIWYFSRIKSRLCLEDFQALSFKYSQVYESLLQKCYFSLNKNCTPNSLWFPLKQSKTSFHHSLISTSHILKKCRFFIERFSYKFNMMFKLAHVSFLKRSTWFQLSQIYVAIMYKRKRKKSWNLATGISHTYGFQTFIRKPHVKTMQPFYVYTILALSCLNIFSKFGLWNFRRKGRQ